MASWVQRPVGAATRVAQRPWPDKLAVATGLSRCPPRSQRLSRGYPAGPVATYEDSIKDRLGVLRPDCVQHGREPFSIVSKPPSNI